MWKSILMLGGPVLTGVLGWLLKGVDTNGSATLVDSILLLAFGSGSAVVVWWAVLQSGWKKGGGKLDGKLDANELKGILHEVLGKLGLQSLDGLADQWAPRVAEVLPELPVARLKPFSVIGESTLSGLTATQLVDALKAWDTDQAVDPTSSALYATQLDLLSEVVRGDTKGATAAADMRAALHRIAFPTSTSQGTAAV